MVRRRAELACVEPARTGLPPTLCEATAGQVRLRSARLRRDRSAYAKATAGQDGGGQGSVPRGLSTDGFKSEDCHIHAR
jgi:hypothetical protein